MEERLIGRKILPRDLGVSFCRRLDRRRGCPRPDKEQIRGYSRSLAGVLPQDLSSTLSLLRNVTKGVLGDLDPFPLFVLTLVHISPLTSSLNPARRKRLRE